MRAQGLARVLAVVAFVPLPVAAWASPVLIEGVRSAVTDAQGIYKVVGST